MKRLLLASILFAVAAASTGCASAIQAANGYASAAADSVKMANDAAVNAWSAAACATPIGAVARNPRIIDAVKSLCVDQHDTRTAQLLDAVAAANTKPVMPATGQ